MIDKMHIGALISRHTVDVEAGRLRFFAKATGQADRRYTDLAAVTGQVLICGGGRP